MVADCLVDADGRSHHQGSGPARRKQRKEVASTAVLEKLLLSYYNLLSAVLLLELYIYINDCVGWVYLYVHKLLRSY